MYNYLKNEHFHNLIIIGTKIYAAHFTALLINNNVCLFSTYLMWTPLIISS